MKTGLQIIAIIMVVLIGGFLGRVIPPFLSHLTNKADVAGPTLSAVPAPAKEEAKPTPPHDAGTRQENWPGTKWEHRTIENSDIPLTDHQKRYEEKNRCRLTRLDDGTVLCMQSR